MLRHQSYVSPKLITNPVHGLLTPGILGTVVKKGCQHLALGATIIDDNGGDSEQVSHLGDIGSLAGLVSMHLQREVIPD